MAEGNMNSVCCRGAGYITSPEHTEIFSVLLSVVRKTADQLTGDICDYQQRPCRPTRFAASASPPFRAHSRVGPRPLRRPRRAQGMRTFRFPKVHPAEISKEFLQTLGFRPAGGHLLYAARARSE